MANKHGADGELNGEPTVLRLRFARVEPAIWLAHLDLMRTFERAVRRAQLPVAYSHGFNPRPHLAFALPIGTGLATQDDYVDIELTQPVEPQTVIDALGHSLPQGLSILAARPVNAAGPSLMSLVRAAEYRLEGKGLAQAAAKLQAMEPQEPWPVEKQGKGGRRTLDIRPMLLRLTIENDQFLIIQVQAGSQQNLRPDLFLAALVSLGGLDATDAANTAITRLKLLVADELQPGQLTSPIPLDDEQ